MKIYYTKTELTAFVLSSLIIGLSGFFICNPQKIKNPKQPITTDTTIIQNDLSSNDLVAIETICYEAQTEPYAGQLAVASVIRYRMKKRNKTAEEIVKQPYQFSCWNAGVVRPDITAETWQTACRAWEESKENKFESDLYYNPKLCDPFWAHTDKVVFVCKIGNHIFMKEC